MLTLTTNLEVVKNINHADVYQLNQISTIIQQLSVNVSSTIKNELSEHWYKVEQPINQI